MAYGNMGDNSGTGVAFTRDPGTGEKRFFGEYLINAQGEDVVAGVRTPVPIAELKKQMPKIYAELEKIYKRLEKHYRDMQDIEFTIQDGKLYMLQCRVGQAHRGRGRQDRRRSSQRGRTHGGWSTSRSSRSWINGMWSNASLPTKRTSRLLPSARASRMRVIPRR